MSDKSLVVTPTGTGLYIIKYTGGGGIPDELSGKYTSYTAAKLAIEQHQKTVQSSPYIKYPKDKTPKKEVKDVPEGKD